MGGIYPKFYQDMFQPFLNDLPARPFSEVKITLEAELGKPIDQVFASFNEEPLGVASIGQAHRAVLKESRRTRHRQGAEPDGRALLPWRRLRPQDSRRHVHAAALADRRQWHEVAPNRGRRIYVADAHFGSVDDAEIMALHGMHSILTVKGHTRRFPAKPLADHCGPNAGDWAVMRTPIGHDPSVVIYIYAVGHRRGGEASAPPAKRRHAITLTPRPHFAGAHVRLDMRQDGRGRGAVTLGGAHARGRAWPSPQVPGGAQHQHQGAAAHR